MNSSYLQFCECILEVEQSTPKFIICGNLEVYSLYTKEYVRTISLRVEIIQCKREKSSKNFMHKFNNFQ